MKFKIRKSDLPTILSCLADNCNSFTRQPSVINFLKDNKEVIDKTDLKQFSETILLDCKRSIYEKWYKNLKKKIKS